MKWLSIILLLFSCTKQYYNPMPDKLKLVEWKLNTPMTEGEVAIILGMCDSANIPITQDMLMRVAPLPNSLPLETRQQFITTIGGDRDVPHFTKIIRPAAGAPLYTSSIIDILNLVALFGTAQEFHGLDYTGNGIIDMNDVYIAISNYAQTETNSWTNISINSIALTGSTPDGVHTGIIFGPVTVGQYTYDADIEIHIHSTDMFPITQGRLTFASGSLGGTTELYFTNANL